MRFRKKGLRKRGENYVPMINVVFLLLIFFLMTSQIAPPDPFEITLPSSQSEALAEGRQTLFISADGALSFEGNADEAVYDAIGSRDKTLPLLVKADASVDGAVVAGVLKRLSRTDAGQAILITSSR